MMRAVLDAAESVLDALIALFSGLGAALMLCLTLVVFGEIISRYFLGLPITFSTELTTIIFPWMVFLMAVEVTRNNDHIAISLFRDMARPRVQRFLIILSQGIMLFFALLLVYSSYQLCVASRHITMPVLQFLTKVYQYAAITLSFVFVALVLILRLLREFRGESGARPAAGRAEKESGR